MKLCHLAFTTLNIGAMVVTASAAQAEDYPTRTVRIITGGVGGSNDLLARMIAQGVAGPLAQPVVVDLRNIYRPEEMAALGFTYESVGRPPERRS